MRVAITFHETYSPEPYCHQMRPAETRLFDDTATLSDIWAWAKAQDPYVRWHQLTFTNESRED